MHVCVCVHIKRNLLTFVIFGWSSLSDEKRRIFENSWFSKMEDALGILTNLVLVN